VIRTALLSRSYEVAVAHSGITALKLLRTKKFDLVFLGEDQGGRMTIETCRAIRSEAPKVAIVMVLSRGNGKNNVYLLDAGADDVVRKRFDLPEVLARVRAARRSFIGRQTAEVSPVRLGDIRIDFQSRQVLTPNEQIRLTPTEFDLLSYFVANRNRTISHQELMQAVEASEGKTDSLRVMVERLRPKIERSLQSTQYLITHRWVGYRMRLPT
jgi:DNA-binding response OmpR family regulator